MCISLAQHGWLDSFQIKAIFTLFNSTIFTLSFQDTSLNNITLTIIAIPALKIQA